MEVNMAGFRSFEEITAWQVARELVREIYKVTSSGDFAKDYGLKDQVRRAAVSVVSNIAEGFERGGNKEFIQFLYLAKGSCGEVRTQLYLSRDLGYLTEETFQNLRQIAARTSELIWGLIRYLKETELKGNKFK
jgi:four helix bundle protein